jgi:hypothetical protein
MTTNNQTNGKPVLAALLNDIRTNKDKQETTIGKLIVAMFDLEVSFDAQVLHNYFVKDAKHRKEMQNRILSEFDPEFAKELTFLADQKDIKRKEDREADKIEQINNRHNYMRGEFHKAMTALVACRRGFDFTNNGATTQATHVVKIKVEKSRLILTYQYKGDDMDLNGQMGISARKLISFGEARLIKLGTKAPRVVRAAEPKLENVSTDKTIQSSLETALNSVDMLLSLQRTANEKTGKKEPVTVHDVLKGETDESYGKAFARMAKHLFEHKGTIDAQDVFEFLETNGLKVINTLGNARKSA